jgi:hypothetical protein
MEHPFAITLDVGTSLINHTGSWRTLRPEYFRCASPAVLASDPKSGAAPHGLQGPSMLILSAYHAVPTRAGNAPRIPQPRKLP